MAGEQPLLAAPTASLRSNVHLQEQSPLFKMLPAEIRSLIYTYTLTDYEDTAHKSYDRNTYWYRPGYKAKRRTATELLRSCKRIFHETWFMPFALAEHSFYLGHKDRAPPTHITAERMKEYLTTLREFSQSQDGMDIPQIHSIRVFAQLWALENGTGLKNILNLEGFDPQSVSITIRYTDFWHWEINHPLHIDARWVNSVIFPKSVTQITIDFEMVERRKLEIDFIADLAVDKWVFQRADGIILRASKQDVVTSRWTGSSTWSGARWIRDESRPNEIDYYLKTVTWKPVSDGNTLAGYQCPNLDLPPDFNQEPCLPGQASVSVQFLEARGLTHEASAQNIYAVLSTPSLHTASMRRVGHRVRGRRTRNPEV